jgi:hypothetical protein
MQFERKYIRVREREPLPTPPPPSGLRQIPSFGADGKAIPYVPAVYTDGWRAESYDIGTDVVTLFRAKQPPR